MGAFAGLGPLMREVLHGAAPGELIVRDDDRIHRMYGAANGETIWIFCDGVVYEVAAESGRRRTAQMAGALTAPMPATVVAVNVAAGDEVKPGDVLIVLEAMKMELPVRASGAGRVAAVHCRPGELVRPDVALIEFAPPDAPAGAGPRRGRE
jgi:acetyl/propionyl-CoA carboxylase alpha subunit